MARSVIDEAAQVLYTDKVSSQEDLSPLTEKLNQALAEHRAGHFGRARSLAATIPDVDAAKHPEQAASVAALRERFRPDWFALLMLFGGLLLFVLIVASTWR
ncbi:MAG: hypothetical protein JNM40_25475 [Myxococcales bacterium]|nr:hypothetical protein [Myxococcales bacterium]